MSDQPTAPTKSTVEQLRPKELAGLRRLGWTYASLNEKLPSEARVILKKRECRPGSSAFLKKQKNPLTGTEGVEDLIGDFSDEAIAKRNKHKDPPTGVEVKTQRTDTLFVRESDDENQDASAAMDRLRDGFEHLTNDEKRIVDGTSQILDREFNRREAAAGKVGVEAMPDLVDEWMKKNADSISRGKGTVFDNAAKAVMQAHPELAFRWVDPHIQEGLADVEWTPYEGPASKGKRVVVGRQTLCYIPRKLNEMLIAQQMEENQSRIRTVADEHRRARHEDERLGSDSDKRIDNIRLRRGADGPEIRI